MRRAQEPQVLRRSHPASGIRLHVIDLQTRSALTSFVIRRYVRTSSFVAHVHLISHGIGNMS